MSSVEHFTFKGRWQDLYHYLTNEIAPPFQDLPRAVQARAIYEHTLILAREIDNVCDERIAAIYRCGSLCAALKEMGFHNSSVQCGSSSKRTCTCVYWPVGDHDLTSWSSPWYTYMLWDQREAIKRNIKPPGVENLERAKCTGALIHQTVSELEKVCDLRIEDRNKSSFRTPTLPKRRKSRRRKQKLLQTIGR